MGSSCRCGEAVTAGRGSAPTDRGLVIEVSGGIRTVRVVPRTGARLAQDAGTTWGDFDYAARAFQVGDDRWHHPHHGRRSLPRALGGGIWLSLARAQAVDRQPCLGRRRCRRRKSCDTPSGTREPGPVLGPAGWRQQLQGRHVLRVRATNEVDQVLAGPLVLPDLEDAGDGAPDVRTSASREAPEGSRSLPVIAGSPRRNRRGRRDRWVGPFFPGAWSAGLDRWVGPQEPVLQPFRDVAPIVADQAPAHCRHGAEQGAFDALYPKGLPRLLEGGQFVEELPDEAIAAAARTRCAVPRGDLPRCTCIRSTAPAIASGQNDAGLCLPRRDLRHGDLPAGMDGQGQQARIGSTWLRSYNDTLATMLRSPAAVRRLHAGRNKDDRIEDGLPPELRAPGGTIERTYDPAQTSSTSTRDLAPSA